MERTADGVVYSWAMLPKTPLLVTLFGALALVPLVLGILAPVAALAMLLEGEWILVITLGIACVVFLRIGWYFLPFLLGRCRLSLDRRRLLYEEFILAYRNGRACHDVPAADIARLRIGDPERGGLEVQRRDGLPFFLRLPVGTGAFSMNDLMQLKEQWTADLGLAEAGPGQDAKRTE